MTYGNNRKSILWSFLFGVTTGGLLGISIKYPVSNKVVTESTELCQLHGGVSKFRVGLSGKVYEVKCKNGKMFDLK